jgi:chromosome segregation ATPase|tara:strand:- start:392 stop:655 length:264 start_codon:yes stop_codon:yes gene_type:complete
MLDIFWNKTCKSKGVTPRAEVLKMERQIQKLLMEIKDREQLITNFSSNLTALNQKHVERHEAGIAKAMSEIEEIQNKLDNCKKEFDK